ncbi:MAG: phospho-N-acetylmuramoyl-pentapeptide-transferase [Actinomycetota bacterium]|nr:phospho-N-acetylmuramoyl-pentapeptide-transferase [Actinomycetota bacterium]MDK1016422.1 phospho-N-acetylmuramoyl-pentapeptide-transferase [Actinomycetota bacterium]MDK1026156.1 phospho-N-acetylmuramoyl-pentapeptide-transferase [Actinomycetota bacterium]MDK1038004.1 phospho-N-acetylmuramoyl-pentapeptide-transferase [Actinomycetota bacterium]MDK1096088.1 phospho-N-acetylmuramoyl-pentapeptide-transferase [Actinomycetota bacterium]
MISLLLSSAFAFVLVIFVTPIAIRILRRRNIGQFIQSEVEGHMHKQGVPTMGGVIIVSGAVIGYLLAHFKVFTFGSGFGFVSQEMSDKALLGLFALIGMAIIGFADDYTKYARKRNEGLSKRWKFGGQLIIAGVFAWGATAAGVSTDLSFTRPLGIDLGPVLFFVLVLLMLTATANAVNLTDGLDGLVAGSSALAFGAYVLIAFWQSRNPSFYQVDGSLDLAIFAAAVLGAALAFLWWNAAPAKIIMGDTGSHALGGALAALALLTNTQMLLLIIGGLYVVETLSVIAQIISFRGFGRRVFLMAPIHHHFELKGWPETTVIIRFWILSGIMVAMGVGLFYADWVAGPGSIVP